ncbi:GNAT family N-acetyltransferase [Virgibacillus proomii]|uniref:GNAT family N-acetyltransferase n=1 Tax=Virgibacillus proomii TaxID=84407 RepID=UPI000985A116|nr:GNAT family N-acetyltransferase [Virgibacillus proomii]
MDVLIRKATLADREEVLTILKNAAQWIQKQGINQWAYLLSGKEDDAIETDIRTGITYMVELDKEAVATFSLSSEQNEWDRRLWGKLEDHAFYLHRLAVHRDHGGKQIGEKVLNCISKQAVKIGAVIRLDCVSDNPRLNDFYQKNGFTFLHYRKV